MARDERLELFGRADGLVNYLLRKPLAFQDSHGIRIAFDAIGASAGAIKSADGRRADHFQSDETARPFLTVLQGAAATAATTPTERVAQSDRVVFADRCVEWA
jgi:hypothetical protein